MSFLNSCLQYGLELNYDEVRFIIIQKFYQNNRSFVQTRCSLRNNFGINNLPTMLVMNID